MPCRGGVIRTNGSRGCDLVRCAPLRLLAESSTCRRFLISSDVKGISMLYDFNTKMVLISYVVYFWSD